MTYTLKSVAAGRWVVGMGMAAETQLGGCGSFGHVRGARTEPALIAPGLSHNRNLVLAMTEGTGKAETDGTQQRAGRPAEPRPRDRARRL